MEKPPFRKLGKRNAYRFICWEAHGPFPDGWNVHHIDGDHHNNDPENLIAVPAAIHQKLHRVEKWRGMLPDRASIQSMITFWENHERKPKAKLPRKKKLWQPDPLLRKRVVPREKEIADKEAVAAFLDGNDVEIKRYGSVRPSPYNPALKYERSNRPKKHETKVIRRPKDDQNCDTPE